MSLPPVRRVVTGHGEGGRAVIIEDGTPATSVEIEMVPGTVFHEIWATDAVPAHIGGPDPTRVPFRLGPPAGGTRFRVVDIPPDSVQNAMSPDDVAKAFVQMGAPMSYSEDGPHALMHRTETIDYGIVLAGEIWLVVDEGETLLRPGDVVIQRGTNHAWSNRTEEPARMAFILVDGRFV